RSEYALPPLSDDEVSVPLPDLVEQLANSDQEYVVSGYMTPDSDTQERLAIVRLKTVPWYLVVSQPASLYYAPAQRQTQGILLLTIALTMISLFSSYFIARRVTRPIRDLTAAAEQVAEGKLYVKAPITSQDEVGTLAQAFNVMTTELEAAHSTLEERVQRRTQELSEANQKLKHEIAERERYEKQVLDLALEHERRRILSEFIQKASHEFRTPLSIINVKSYLVKRLLPADQQHHLDVIQVQGEHIHELVNRMVLMSRLDSGVQATSEYLEIDGFMKSVYTGRANAFKEKNAIAHLELQAPDTWVYVDPDMLSIALYNILDNALQHSTPPVEITIKTRITGETVAIIIEDNGVGIPPELHNRVFERFFRVDEAHTTRGFGLGLPIAKRIIENTGVSIELESQVGKGTTVTIALGIKSKEVSPLNSHQPDSLAASD
ncbi:partial Sensor histidine kinase WalK, partial [Anaerolineae bacterium]